MTNKILKIALALSIVTLTLLQAESKYERNHNNNTINVTSSENDKIFIREYKYNASDTDSKVSSRKKAITQLKSILSEEVGVHIESSLEMKNTVRNGVNIYHPNMSRQLFQKSNSLNTCYPMLHFH